MKVTAFSKRALKYRREERKMTKDGWERVTDSGGKMWELVRGYRKNMRITKATPACDGKSIWIFVEQE